MPLRPKMPLPWRIYNQGIEDRGATFEVRPRSALEIAAWFDGAHPIVVVEEDGEILALAATFPYRPRDCYSGIAETPVYVAREARRRSPGPGDADRCRRARIRSLGFREVGVYEKHARLDGQWRDCRHRRAAVAG